jgi:hypothetical protein
MASFVEKIRREQAKLAALDADPLLRKVQEIVRSEEGIGRASLLDLLGLKKTTANGRRLARTMRTLGFVPIKSRRLMPGGWRDTVTRDWARPLRGPRSNPTMKPTADAECQPRGGHLTAFASVAEVKRGIVE